jgi:hypothetical protein
MGDGALGTAGGTPAGRLTRAPLIRNGSGSTSPGCPTTGGGFVLRVTQGDLAEAMAADWNVDAALIEGAGYGGQALRSRTPVADIQGSRSVSAGILATSEVIGELDAVQARIGQVLEEQVQMAKAFERTA